MKYKTDDEEIMKTAAVRADSARPDVSSVFMTLARRALAACDETGMPPEVELKRLAKWCEFHRLELFELSKIQGGPESRQRRIWLYELASMPTGRWVDLRFRLSSFIRLFGLPPRSQYKPFMSAESEDADSARRLHHSTSHASGYSDGSNEEISSLVTSGSSEGSFYGIKSRSA